MALNFNGFFGAQLNDEPQEIDLDAPKKSKMKKSPLMRFSDKGGVPEHKQRVLFSLRTLIH
ncbi:hypothetical protein [Vibrio phage J14]|nr:hypothetical protein [Vibrio phage J14]